MYFKRMQYSSGHHIVAHINSDKMTAYLTNDNSSPAMDGTSINAQGNGFARDSCDAVDAEFLIVGAGPAGAALACFLGSHGMYLHSRAKSWTKSGEGLQGIMISSASRPANTPRAHITNMAALGQSSANLAPIT